jgi:hypothetical protein
MPEVVPIKVIICINGTILRGLCGKRNKNNSDYISLAGQNWSLFLYGKGITDFRHNRPAFPLLIENS